MLKFMIFYQHITLTQCFYYRYSCGPFSGSARRTGNMDQPGCWSKRFHYRVVYALDDPNLPKAKTYQQIIPGSRRVIDASHFPKLGTGYRINQSFNDNRINVRAYACSKSPKVINYNFMPTLIYYFFQRETKTLFFTRLFVESRPELSALRGMGEITGWMK